MSRTEKAVWEEESLVERVRYRAERAVYKANSKHRETVGAPKRPMSAYLMFSNARRGKLRKEHPELSNGDLSRALSQQWREAAPSSKAEYVHREQELRRQYKVDMAEWRKKKAADEKKERKRLRLEARRRAQADRARLLGLNLQQVEDGLAKQGSGSATTESPAGRIGRVLPLLGTGTVRQIGPGTAHQLGTGTTQELGAGIAQRLGTVTAQHLGIGTAQHLGTAVALPSLASPPLVGNVSMTSLGRLVGYNSRGTRAALDGTNHGVQVDSSVAGNGVLGVANSFHVPVQASLQPTFLASILGTLRLSS